MGTFFSTVFSLYKEHRRLWRLLVRNSGSGMTIIWFLCFRVGSKQRPRSGWRLQTNWERPKWPTEWKGWMLTKREEYCRSISLPNCRGPTKQCCRCNGPFMFLHYDTIPIPRFSCALRKRTVHLPVSRVALCRSENLYLQTSHKYSIPIVSWVDWPDLMLRKA